MGKMKACILTDKKTKEEYIFRSPGYLADQLSMNRITLIRIIENRGKIKINDRSYYIRQEYHKYQISHCNTPKENHTSGEDHQIKKIITLI